MATFSGLEIPSGMEDLFYKIFAIGNSGTSLGYRFVPSVAAPQRKASLSNRSLFVRWCSMYDAFDSGRKAAWTAYWATLPFGGHTGAGGWPGSGFSAFVYQNAPHYQKGEALELDPPVLNLVYNGDFSLGDAGWHLYDGAVVTAGVLHLDGLPNPYNAPNASTDDAHLITLESDATYRLQCWRDADAGADLNFFRVRSYDGRFYNIADFGAGVGVVSTDFYIFQGTADWTLGIFSNNAPSLLSVDDIKLFKIG
jgi:hypothetical protein